MRILPIALLTLIATAAIAEEPAAAPTEAPAVDVADTWDLAAIFPTIEDWEAAVADAEKEIEALPAYQGQLSSPATLEECLVRVDSLSLAISRIDSYASNHMYGDTRDAEWRARSQKASLLWAGFSEAISWLDPELLALGAKKVDKAVSKRPGLAPFDYLLSSTLRRGAHTLPSEQEALLAAALPLRMAPSEVHGVLLHAELPWPELTLDDDTTVTLDVSAYAKYRASSSRPERQRAFDGFYGAFGGFQGTAGSLLGSAAQGDWFNAKARGYGSSLEAALDQQFIPEAVYTTLIERTNANLPTLHRYLALRERMLGVDQLNYSDLYTPLLSVDKEFTLQEAKDLVIASSAPLGQEYIDVLEEGFSGRWMDVYPRPGKASGAYMDDSCYDLHPFVLTNFNGDYLSVSTLAHEWGHAEHSAFASTSQPHAKADYAIFVAEVPSTFAEAMLLDHVLELAEDDDERLLYLGEALEGLRTTFFRQAMFAEFELALHQKVEDGEPITGEALSAEYLELVRRYHGHDDGVTVVDEQYAVEWVFVPHFYYNFYVWKYATSIAASSLLAKDVLEEEEGAVERFLDLMRAGGSDDPYVVLAEAGVDLATPEPYDALAARMESIMDQIEEILDRQESEATPTE